MARRRQVLRGPRSIARRAKATSFSLGDADFHILHTPGHTQGSISIWIPAENKLVAGDTLFRDSIGRTDLPGGDGRQILRSIHEKLLALPGDGGGDSGPRSRTRPSAARKRAIRFYKDLVARPVRRDYSCLAELR